MEKKCEPRWYPVLAFSVWLLVAVSFVKIFVVPEDEPIPVYRLIGDSNEGLWNGRLTLGVKDEKNLWIRVDSQVPLSSIKAGDIVVFISDQDNNLVAHPVVAIEGEIVKTKGFDNKHVDLTPVDHKHYKGKVVGVADTQNGPWKMIR